MISTAIYDGNKLDMFQHMSIFDVNKVDSLPRHNVANVIIFQLRHILVWVRSKIFAEKKSLRTLHETVTIFATLLA